MLNGFNYKILYSSSILVSSKGILTYLFYEATLVPSLSK
jgi:NADH:ubiquinone oxidoreductase subunit 4 (subunit M)